MPDSIDIELANTEVIYEIEDKAVQVFVLEIVHRGKAYD